MPRGYEVRGYNEISRNLRLAANLIYTTGYRDQLWRVGQEMRSDCMRELRRAVYDTPPGEYERTGFLMATIYVENYDDNDFAERRAQGMILVRASGKPPSAMSEYQAVPSGPRPRKLDVKVAASAIYAQRVEYGPHIRGARPFMRPAIEANSDKYVRMLESRLRALLRSPLQLAKRALGGD